VAVAERRFDPSPEAPTTAISDAEIRELLMDYDIETTDAQGIPQPVMVLHNLGEDIRIDPRVELPSAFHMASYVHRFVGSHTQAITVIGRFAKVIGARTFVGTLLYHVDRVGSHLLRGLDAKHGWYWTLDDAPYWAAFPYDFARGPIPPEGPLGFHPGKA
jgi:hypothetical protein